MMRDSLAATTRKAGTALETQRDGTGGTKQQFAQSNRPVQSAHRGMTVYYAQHNKGVQKLGAGQAS